MKYQLEDINFKTVSDPVAFMAESDEIYRRKVEQAADLIIAVTDPQHPVQHILPVGASE